MDFPLKKNKIPLTFWPASNFHEIKVSTEKINDHYLSRSCPIFMNMQFNFNYVAKHGKCNENSRKKNNSNL